MKKYLIIAGIAAAVVYLTFNNATVYKFLGPKAPGA